MKRFGKPALTAFIFIVIGGLVGAQSLTVASGAGYRALVDELSEMFTTETGIKVERIYGNMGVVTTQARNSGVVDIVIGDKSFFDGVKLPFASEFILGRGRLVLAVAKGVGAPSLDLIDSPTVKRIAFPDAKVAIYGIAATEYLKNSGKRDEVEGKLVQVGTVPQVSAYLMSGEVDLGFINRTDAMAIETKIAGFVEVPEKMYSPIYIVARILPGAPSADAALRFGRFLEKPEVRAVVEKHGL